MKTMNLRKELKEKYEKDGIIFVYIKPGLYMYNIIDSLEEKELIQLDRIITIIKDNYLKFGKYIKINFHKDKNGKIYAAIFNTSLPNTSLDYDAVNLFLDNTGITDEVEFLKTVLRECFIPLQNICDSTKGVNTFKVGAKIKTYTSL